MIIRDAILADLPAIVAIYNAAIPGRMATADTVPVSVESRRAWFETYTPDKRPLWVAEQDRVIAGWLGFSSFYGGRPAYDATAEVSVYVAPEHQRQGVGRTLLADAVRRAPEFGLTTLLYCAFAHNTPSLRLCHAFGFQQWGCLPGIAYLDGVAHDLLFLGRRVDSHAN